VIEEDAAARLPLIIALDPAGFVEGRLVLGIHIGDPDRPRLRTPRCFEMPEHGTQCVRTKGIEEIEHGALVEVEVLGRQVLDGDRGVGPPELPGVLLVRGAQAFVHLDAAGFAHPT